MSAIWFDVVRLLWSKADVYDLVHTPQQVLYNMAPIWYWVSPIWSDLVIRVTPARMANAHLIKALTMTLTLPNTYTQAITLTSTQTVTLSLTPIQP